jgi:hypothetical protein
VAPLGRLIARRLEAPATLVAVSAILPLLPGLAIVQAMLAPTQGQQIALLIDALVTAFAIGVGVASGDIVVATLQRVREHIVEPAVGAVSDGLTALVVRPARLPSDDDGSPATPDGPDEMDSSAVHEEETSPAGPASASGLAVDRR